MTNDAVFSYFLSPTFDFKQEILSHGAGIEVLAPEWFREEVMETNDESRKGNRRCQKQRATSVSATVERCERYADDIVAVRYCNNINLILNPKLVL